MAHLERGVDDADNVYAFDPNEEDDADLETSRLPLLIAIALVVVAAFGGVVWLAYTQGVEEGRADAPRIAAAQTHSAPAKPATNPYAGLNIYQPPASSDAGNEPIAPVPSEQGASAGGAQPVLRPSASATTDKPQAAQAAEKAVPKAVPPPVHTPPSTGTSPKSQAMLPQTTAAMPPPVSAAAGPAPQSAAPASDAAAATSGIVLQIGSYKSDAEARASWNAFKARHPIASAYAADVKEVDLGAKGVWYRLRIGAFQDRQSAAAFCEKLKAQGASCIVSR